MRGNVKLQHQKNGSRIYARISELVSDISKVYSPKITDFTWRAYGVGLPTDGVFRLPKHSRRFLCFLKKAVVEYHQDALRPHHLEAHHQKTVSSKTFRASDLNL